MFLTLPSPGAGETAAEVVLHPSVLLLLVLKFDQKLFFPDFFQSPCDVFAFGSSSETDCHLGTCQGLVTSGVPQPLATTCWSLGFSLSLAGCAGQTVHQLSPLLDRWRPERRVLHPRAHPPCSEHEAPFWILDSLKIVINIHRHNVLIYSHIHHIQYAHYQTESCAEHRNIHLWSVTGSSVNFTRFIRQIRFKSPVNYFFIGLTKCLRMQK